MYLRAGVEDRPDQRLLPVLCLPAAVVLAAPRLLLLEREPEIGELGHDAHLRALRQDVLQACMTEIYLHICRAHAGLTT